MILLKSKKKCVNFTFNENKWILLQVLIHLKVKHCITLVVKCKSKNRSSELRDCGIGNVQWQTS